MKITYIKVNYIGKDGQPLEGQWGPYVKINIQVDDPRYAGKYIGGNFKPDSPVTNWKVGQEVNIDITQNGQWLNFKPSKIAIPQIALPATAGSQTANFILSELKAIRLKLENLPALVTESVVKELAEVEPEVPDGGPTEIDEQPF